MCLGKNQEKMEKASISLYGRAGRAIRHTEDTDDASMVYFYRYIYIYI
jgi:hypothetical protein